MEEKELNNEEINKNIEEYILEKYEEEIKIEE